MWSTLLHTKLGPHLSFVYVRVKCQAGRFNPAVIPPSNGKFRSELKPLTMMEGSTEAAVCLSNKKRPEILLSHIVQCSRLTNTGYANMKAVVDRNLATVITISRMRHFGSFVMYVALLAIADNLAIVVKILFYQLLLYKVPLGSVGCRILQFFGVVLVSWCSWILVLMAIERLVAVRYPFMIHFQSCLTSRKTVWAVSLVGVVICLLCTPILWVSEYDTAQTGCNIKDTPLVQTIHWISVTIHAFVPFTILAVCNFLVAREIRLSFRLRDSFRNVHNFMVGRHSPDVPVQKQIMLMLFTATFMFILLHFPICLFLIINTYWEATEGTTSFDVKYLVQQLAYVLTDSNHAFNFYLYFLSARKFRAHFTHMLVNCEKKHKCSKCAVERYQLRRLHT
ncbi:thyrotropin-releasing hormone receptor [Plakobranchus ocellatus]|uniref:Thyrotropin-releasing hormone receptor n=1 Tax=Plakobranchus ocellatus TaxID=259542 RepID=A0AAV3YN25_9GAST|nr:thyrotropin-releasing hormone receptor [Plakobranchus ocellatus]